MATYYEILEISSNATEREIKKSYYKLSQQWHPDKWSTENDDKKKIAENKFKEISVAHGVLSDNEKREFYDKYGDRWEEKYNETNQSKCKNCNKCGKIFLGKHFENGIPDKVFCSWKCANDFWQERFKKKDKRCRNCESIHNENQGVPQKCEKILNAISELENLSNWFFFSPSEKEFFEKEIKSAGTYFFPSDDFDKQIKKTLQRANDLNTNKKDALDQERIKYIQQLKNLDGWDLLSDETKKSILEGMERNRGVDNFSATLQFVKKQINNLREGNGEDKENLAVEIQKAAGEIEGELNKEPKVSEEEFVSNWREYLQDSDDFDQVKIRKQEILEAIGEFRERGQQIGLNQLRKKIIQQIWSELAKKPPIENKELDQPNWEEQLNSLFEESELKKLRDEVLADIYNKRIIIFLSQAHQEENWNNYQNLENIFKQIKELRSSNVYQEKETEIKIIENRLRELDPLQFQKTAGEFLDQQVKDNGLTNNDLDEETKQALKEAKQDPTQEKITKAEEKIAVFRAKKDLNIILNKVSETKNEEEKKALIQEILVFIKKNKFTGLAYQSQKQKVDKLLAELRGVKPNDAQSSSFWKKIPVVPLLIISLLGIMIVGFLIWRKRQLKKIDKKY